MKTLRNYLVVMIVLCLMTLLQASEPTEMLVVNTASVTEVSYESVNPKIQVLNPAPVKGYGILKEKIEYPEFARIAGIEPCLVVRAYIDASGQVRDCRMISGPEKIGFEEAVINAVKDTKWLPAIYDGNATPSNLDITFEFKLYD